MPHKKKTRIVVGICSCLKAEERRIAVRESWLKADEPDFLCRFFVGGKSEEYEKNDIVYLSARDGYEYLPEKVLAFFRYALEHYDFDWLYKCDDDTFVALSRLKELLSPHFDFVGDMLLQHRNAPSGGAGYLLSRHIVEKIVLCPDIPQRGYEDLIYGELALKMGANPMVTDRLNCLPTPYPMPHNNLISSHWCSPDYLRAIKHFNQNAPIAFFNGKHKNWNQNDIIEFYKNNFFRRKISGCAGRYLFMSRMLSLKWFSWEEEQLVLHNGTYYGKDFILEKHPDSPHQEIDAISNKSSSPLYIQFGSGKNILPEWVNLDMPGFDISEPLPFPDESVDSYFLEHVIEHVDNSQAYAFFEEAWRTLKKGGIMRLAFPDLVKISKNITPEYLQFLQKQGWGDNSCDSAIRSIIVNHGHKSIWTEETMSIVLGSVGFRVEKVMLGNSRHAHLKGIEYHGNMIGDKFNLLETACLEALKPN